jgi:flagellar biosynthesis/type III secretory pathway protein FliH
LPNLDVDPAAVPRTGTLDAQPPTPDLRAQIDDLKARLLASEQRAARLRRMRDRAASRGRAEGYTAGHSEGFDAGNADGYASGFEAGYNNGVLSEELASSLHGQEEYQRGYADGHSW